MEKYKANKNGSTGENVEQEQPQKTQDQINTENNANTLKNAAKVAKATKNPYAMAAGYAVEGLDKLTGGKSTEMLGNIVTHANKTLPGAGKIIQDTSNKLAESGIGDKVGQVADMKNNMSGSGSSNASKSTNIGKSMPKASNDKAGAKPSSNNNTNNSKSSADFGSNSSMFTDNIMSGMSGFNMKKIAIIASVSFIFIIIMLIVGYMGQKDMQNMAITNLTVFSESSAGGMECTNDQIDEMLVYIGGNTINDMASQVSSNASFISYVNGYNDFKNNILSSIETKLNTMQKGVVILSFDVYDLSNFDSYVVDYKDLINKYPKLDFYVLSLGQVIDGNSYGITNAIINEYNKKIINNFGNVYLDFNSYIGGSFSSSNGISYDSSTYNNIHSYVLNSVVSAESIICNGGSIETMTDEQFIGGNATILGLGETIEDRIGSDDLTAWNNALVNDVKNAGIGNGLAPAIAVFGLIQGALNRDFVIPYFPSGGHNPISTGVDGSWGESSSVTINGVTSNLPKGLDDTGLIAWAIKNGGCSSFSHKNYEQLKNLGEVIYPIESTPGDIIVGNNHAMMVLYNDGFSIIVAEANKDYGVIFNSYYHNVLNIYDIISMSNYYHSC